MGAWLPLFWARATSEVAVDELLNLVVLNSGNGGRSSGLGIFILIISALKTFDLNEGKGGT